MTISRIFSELDSREFQFKVEGIKYKLPHLNTLKKQIATLAEMMETDNTINDYKIMFYLFDAAGVKSWSKKSRELSLRDSEKIFTAWCEWSGVVLGKLLKAYEIIGEYPNAFEADLFERNMDYNIFFSMPLRTQFNLVNILANDLSSALYAGINNYPYRWSRELEITAIGVESNVQLHLDPAKHPKPWRVPRPSDDQKYYTDENDKEQDRIDALLPKLSADF